MRDIHRGLRELDNEIMRLGDFIRSSKDAYENAEKKIDAELANPNNLFNKASGNTYEVHNYPVNDNGRNPLETSLEHIGDLFRRIGQAIVNMFMPQKDPKELFDLANNFINGNPHTSIAYRVVEDVDIPPVTGDFEYTCRPIIGNYTGGSNLDKAATMGASIFSADMWTDVWLHLKNVGNFVNSVYQDMKDLAIKHQEIMQVLPSEIAALDGESWMTTMKRIPDLEGQYQYAISQIPKDKEAAHAMLLGWMATNPNSRGIDPKYYPQLSYTQGAGALDPNVVDEILALERGYRPAPSTYLSKEYIDNHLVKFDGGVTRIQWEAPNRPVGPPQGTFIMSKSVADDLIEKSGGDVRKLEQLLGLDNGYLGDAPVRVDIPEPTGLRMPSGMNQELMNSGYQVDTQVVDCLKLL